MWNPTKLDHDITTDDKWISKYNNIPGENNHGIFDQVGNHNNINKNEWIKVKECFSRPSLQKS